MNYRYDGSFDGLLTVIFDAYPERANIGEVRGETEQLRFDFEEIWVPTDEEKARRVENYLRKNISAEFFNQLRIGFLSCRPEKDTVAVRTVYRAMTVGAKIMNLAEEDVLTMFDIVRQVLRERHRYLGLVRFREMTDGTLLAVIEPKNNVLPLLLSHFKARLTGETFAIFDKKRGMLAYCEQTACELFFTDSVEEHLGEEEKNIQELWKIFHRSIAIQERTNRKLQRQNLPKYYWKHLVEEWNTENQI